MMIGDNNVGGNKRTSSTLYCICIVLLVTDKEITLGMGYVDYRISLPEYKMGILLDTLDTYIMSSRITFEMGKTKCMGPGSQDAGKSHL